MDLGNIKNTLVGSTKDRVKRTVLDPINQMVDQNITDISTTIGSFVIRSIRGKFQRSITFTIGRSFADNWMEEALYGILYKYNDIKSSSRLELCNPKGMNDGSGLHYQLDDGTHNLKYRDFDILLAIQTVMPQESRRITPTRIYTIITYDLSPEFVKLFEKDMLTHRNSLLRINSDSPFITIYKDYHEGDGYTYWEKDQTVLKRRLNTIYLPHETKKLIVDTINNFFASKSYYRKHGITHNLKILMYSAPGLGKDSIVKMIASEWNRNIYYISGGKNGKFIPNALIDHNDDIRSPLFVVSDIDKYPMVINEPDMNADDANGSQNEKIEHKQTFGAMINALDGILSGEDKIIIMTTNHIEKFSEAFLRPGRIDLLLEIPYVNEEVFKKYVWDFYGKEVPKDIKLKSDKLRISEMQLDVAFLKLSYEEFLKKYVK